jgi:DNA-binding response OmpR family regulator
MIALPRILSISYDRTLLETRELVLQRAGYDVLSLSRLKELTDAACNDIGLIIMGHSIPQPEKRAMVADLRRRGCNAPVLALLRGDESSFREAADSVKADPEPMLEAVRRILGGTDRRAQSARSE